MELACNHEIQDNPQTPSIGLSVTSKKQKITFIAESLPTPLLNIVIAFLAFKEIEDLGQINRTWSNKIYFNKMPCGWVSQNGLISHMLAVHIERLFFACFTCFCIGPKPHLILDHKIYLKLSKIERLFGITISFSRISSFKAFFPEEDLNDLNYIQRFTALQDLYLSGCKNIDNTLKNCLKHCPSIHALFLSCCTITDAGLTYINGLTNLQKFALIRCELTSVSCSYLSNLSYLESLYISEIDDSSLKRLTCQDSLQELEILESSFTGQGLAHFTALKVLKFNDCPEISDSSLENISHLPLLEELDLSGCKKITDNGLKNLCHLKTLEILYLSGCRITDKGLKELLIHLKALKVLHCHGCRDITDEYINYLKTYLKEGFHFDEGPTVYDVD